MSTPGREPVLVGVIVTAYHTGSLLRPCLQSLLAQTMPRWRAVIVDDASTDDTAEIAAEIAATDDRITMISNADNVGVSAARNVGFEAVADDVGYVLYLDGDDELQPDALAALVAALESHPDAAGAFGYADVIGDDDSLYGDLRLTQRRTYHAGQRVYSSDLFVDSKIYPPACVLIRTAKHREAGRYDVERLVLEDWEFYLRLTATGPLVCCGSAVALYRRHDRNLTTKSAASIGWRTHRQRLEVYRSLDAGDRRAFHAQWRRHYRALATSAPPAQRFAYTATGYLGRPSRPLTALSAAATRLQFLRRRHRRAAD